MSIREKYGLTFISPRDSRSRGWIRGHEEVHANNTLQCIQDFHIGECEYLVEEIENAQNGEQYDDSPNFDFANPYLELKYPNVEIHDFVISMIDFKALLQEWIQFNRGYNPNIS